MCPHCPSVQSDCGTNTLGFSASLDKTERHAFSKQYFFPSHSNYDSFQVITQISEHGMVANRTVQLSLAKRPLCFISFILFSL